MCWSGPNAVNFGLLGRFIFQTSQINYYYVHVNSTVPKVYCNISRDLRSCAWIIDTYLAWPSKTRLYISLPSALPSKSIWPSILSKCSLEFISIHGSQLFISRYVDGLSCLPNNLSEEQHDHSVEHSHHWETASPPPPHYHPWYDICFSQTGHHKCSPIILQYQPNCNKRKPATSQATWSFTSRNTLTYLW